MKIEVKNIQYMAALSEETNAYAAKVYVDGKHVINVSNTGHGGSDSQYPVPPYTYEDVRKLDAYIKTTYPVRVASFIDPKTGKPFQHEADLESICNDAVADFLSMKDMKRALARKVLYVKETGGPVWEMGMKGSRALTLPARTELTRRIKEREPKAIVLNDLPAEEAIKHWIAAAKA